jgi:hypothetical protein
MLVFLTMVAFAAGAQLCKQTSFIGMVTSEDNYSHPFAPNLRFRLKPLKDDLGWVVSIGGKDSNENWTYPVTFPIRTGERQVIGTEYGVTVQKKMKQATVVKFVLTHSDFVEYSELQIRLSLRLGRRLRGSSLRRWPSCDRARLRSRRSALARETRLRRSNG